MNMTKVKELVNVRAGLRAMANSKPVLFLLRCFGSLDKSSPPWRQPDTEKLPCPQPLQLRATDPVFFICSHCC